MKRRIFIAGHGMMSQVQGVNLPVHFYVNSGILLDNVFIPGIIQLVSGNANFNYLQLTQVQPPIEGHNQKINTSYEHVIFTLADDNHELCRTYKYNNNIGVWNRVVGVPKYSIVGIARPFFNPPQNIQIANINVNQHTGNETLGLNNDILIYPTQIIGIPTHENIKAFLTLSDIIEWAGRTFPGDDLEFHWLACREYLQ